MITDLNLGNNNKGKETHLLNGSFYVLPEFVLGKKEKGGISGLSTVETMWFVGLLQLKQCGFLAFYSGHNVVCWPSTVETMWFVGLLQWNKYFLRKGCHWLLIVEKRFLLSFIS